MRFAVFKALLTWVFALAIPNGDEPDIWLEILPSHASISADSDGTIPDANIDSFRIVIAHQPDKVNYGTILAKINTESANIVMEVKSTSDGIVCDFDLTRRGGFRLHPGRNSVEIVFLDSRHRVRYASFLLQTPEEGVVPQVAPFGRPERAPGKKYALVVGISKYRDAGPGLPALLYADHDAQAFYDFLISPKGGGFQESNVKLLLNADANLENVRMSLKKLLTESNDADMVLFFFVGHGGADRHDGGTPDGKANLYLATSDVDPDNISETAFSVSEFQQLLESSTSLHNFVTFADACHTLGLHGPKDLKQSRQNNLINQYLGRFAGSGDRAVITASDISQMSVESDRWGGGHGVFTYYVLRGLRGEADLDRDGTITVGELFSFVRDHVYKETGGVQRPIARPGSAANLTLKTSATTAKNNSSIDLQMR